MQVEWTGLHRLFSAAPVHSGGSDFGGDEVGLLAAAPRALRRQRPAGPEQPGHAALGRGGEVEQWVGQREQPLQHGLVNLAVALLVVQREEERNLRGPGQDSV